MSRKHESGGGGEQWILRISKVFLKPQEKQNLPCCYLFEFCCTPSPGAKCLQNKTNQSPSASPEGSWPWSNLLSISLSAHFSASVCAHRKKDFCPQMCVTALLCMVMAKEEFALQGLKNHWSCEWKNWEKRLRSKTGMPHPTQRALGS